MVFFGRPAILVQEHMLGTPIRVYEQDESKLEKVFELLFHLVSTRVLCVVSYSKETLRDPWRKAIGVCRLLLAKGGPSAASLSKTIPQWFRLDRVYTLIS